MWGERLNKLSDKDRETIWLRADEGATLDELAQRYGVSISTIARVVKDRRQQRNVRTPIAGTDPDEQKAQVEERAEKTARQPANRVPVQARPKR